MSASENAEGSQSVWFSFRCKKDFDVLYLFDYVRKVDATEEDAGYSLTLALKDASYAQRNHLNHEYIARWFSNYISRDLIDPNPTIVVAAVPSSKPQNTDRALDRIARQINRRHGNSEAQVLRRTSEVESAHLGGARDSSTHWQTIGVANQGRVQGRRFLLIDDVATTCTSLDVCREKLLRAGAVSVECAVFSKTFDEYADSRKSVDFQKRRSRANAFLQKARKKDGFAKTVLPGMSYGELLEVRRVGNEYRAFLSTNVSIPVPDQWYEYVIPDLNEEVCMGYQQPVASMESAFTFNDWFRTRIQIGDTLKHSSFGVGVVESIDGDSIAVRFLDEGRCHKLIKQYARILPYDKAQYYRDKIAGGDKRYAPYDLVKADPNLTSAERSRLMETASSAGNAAASVELAMEADARGDKGLAASYFERAFEQGEREESPFWLGRYYANLDAPDEEKAKAYYRCAIEHGEVYASPNNLAIMLEGDDREEAIRLYGLAVENGNFDTAASNLAGLIEAEDPDSAKKLYKLASDNGNGDATFRLAQIVEAEADNHEEKLRGIAAEQGVDSEPYRQARHSVEEERALARRLYEMVAGSDSEYRKDALSRLGFLLSKTDPRTAMKYYERAIEAGSVWGPAFQLALLVEREDPQRHLALLNKAVDAGNHYFAALWLARAKLRHDKGAAMELYKLSADAGNPDACNEYALQIQESDPEKAKGYFERGMDAGDKRFCPCNLAKLVRAEDPGRATELFGIAAENGNVDAMNLYALRLRDVDPEKAIAMFERAIACGDTTYSPNNLALFIEKDDRDRAVELYEMSIESGDSYYAPRNYAHLIMDEEPKRAVSLLEKSFDAGNMHTVFELCDLREFIPFSFISKIPFRADDIEDADALLALGVFWLGQKTEKARENAARLFERAIVAGDTRSSTCNLAMMLSDTNPERAIELFEQSLEYGETEAMLGLSWLLEERDPEKARELHDRAYANDNIAESLLFIADYYSSIDVDRAKSLYEEAANHGSESARKALSKLST